MSLPYSNLALLPPVPGWTWTGERAVEGVETSAGAEAFLGLAYAHPPVGELRFRPTVTPELPWSGTKPAKAPGSPCVQTKRDYAGGTSQVVGSEDCLYLNVFRPSKRSAPLPVMVWIHGGAFVGGSGSEASYEGSRLATEGGVRW